MVAVLRLESEDHAIEAPLYNYSESRKGKKVR